MWHDVLYWEDMLSQIIIQDFAAEKLEHLSSCRNGQQTCVGAFLCGMFASDLFVMYGAICI